MMYIIYATQFTEWAPSDENITHSGTEFLFLGEMFKMLSQAQLSGQSSSQQLEKNTTWCNTL